MSPKPIFNHDEESEPVSEKRDSYVDVWVSVSLNSDKLSLREMTEDLPQHEYHGARGGWEKVDVIGHSFEALLRRLLKGKALHKKSKIKIEF